MGAAFSYQIAASDVNGDFLTFTLISGPNGMTVSATGLAEWMPTVEDVGEHTVAVSINDGTFTITHTWTMTVAASLPDSATITDLGMPLNGDLVVSDLVEFDNKIWMIASDQPLDDIGARIYAYDPLTQQFDSMLDCPDTEGGFVRARVIGGKLYVPDSDPPGLAPGRVFIFDSSSAPPLVTEVPGAVHSWDVIEFNGDVYLSGATAAFESALFKYDAIGQTWTTESTGPYGRLCYLAKFNGGLAGSWQLPFVPALASSGSEMVSVTPGGSQSGLDVLSGVAAQMFTVVEVDDALYIFADDPASTSDHIMGRLSAGPAPEFTQLTGFGGDNKIPILLDFVKHSDGNVYGVGIQVEAGMVTSIVAGSEDGINFKIIASGTGIGWAFSADILTGAGNLDGRSSIMSCGGKLYCGSGINGHLYRIDW